MLRLDKLARTIPSIRSELYVFGEVYCVFVQYELPYPKSKGITVQMYS